MIFKVFGKKTKKFSSSFGFFIKSFGFFMFMVLAGRSFFGNMAKEGSALEPEGSFPFMASWTQVWASRGHSDKNIV